MKAIANFTPLLKSYFKEKKISFYLANFLSFLSFLFGFIYLFCALKEYASIWPIVLLITGSILFFIFSYWSPKSGSVVLATTNLFALMMHIYAIYPYLFSLATKGMGINLADNNVKLIITFAVVLFALFAFANLFAWLNMIRKQKEVKNNEK